MNTGLKSLLAVAGVVGVLATGVAVAQVPPGGPEGAPQGGPGEMQRGPEEHGMHGWMHHGGMHRMPPMSKAAHFRFRKGDAMVDIKCADDEPTKACVDAGAALLDKLGTAAK